ncbi:MAG: prephenate dehydrogenase [Desulfovibrionaceae bacterium]|nr:prephenate dehydrogenase [Desulfovibrionaceae bacterium]
MSPASKPSKTLLVGSRGRMGAMLHREAQACGLCTVGVDQPLSQEVVKDKAAGAELVLFCVPAKVLASVLETVCPYLPRDCIVADITSVKEQPLKDMQRIWPGEVVGTHPLFGPNFDRQEPLPVAIVPGRAQAKAIARTASFFTALGFQTFECTAYVHDRAMASLQNLNFISTLAYFALLGDHKELLPFMTPSFRRRLAAAKKMLTEDAQMFAGLFEVNRFSHELVRQYTKVLSLAACGDIELLLEKAQWWLQAEKDPR